MQFRIKWESKLTGATGYGIKSYPYAEASKLAIELNRERGASCTHTVEPVPEDEAEESPAKP